MTQSMLAAVARKRVAGGGFVPTDIAGCVLWLDASQIVGLSDGDPVVTWSNLGTGGSGNDAVQSDSSKRGTYQTGEINSLPVVRLDGSNDSYEVGDFSAESAITSFIVLKRDANTAAYGLWNFSDSDITFYPFAGDGNIYDAFASTVRHDGIVAGVSLQSPHLYSVVSQSGEWTARVNGAQVFTTGTNTVALIAVCKLGMAINGTPWGGDMAEVIVYDSALGTTDRQTVEAYLATKYGL